MSDANWTPATTQQAIALWVGGKDVAEIAVEFGVAPGEVLGRIAQAAIAGEDALPAAGQPLEAEVTTSGASKTSVSTASAPAATKAKAPASKTAPTKTRTAAAASGASSMDAPRKSFASTRSVSKRSVGETAPTEVATQNLVPAGTPVSPPNRPLAAGAEASRPVPLRLVPTPPAPQVEAASAAAPAVARGYEAIALPAPVRTSKRLLVAADGGAGVPFMKATTLDCHFPLWADTETVSIERKRVCGCRALAGKSWCAHHLSAVFEPPRKPQPRVA